MTINAMQILTRKYHPALWHRSPDGEYRMTDLYAELFHSYLVGELNQKRFLERVSEIEAAYDGEEPPF